MSDEQLEYSAKLLANNISLEKRNKEIYEGFMATTEELCEATKEIERLNNIINEALGIANERFNYYHHTNKKEILEDWENIFNVLLRRDNE